MAMVHAVRGAALDVDRTITSNTPSSFSDPARPTPPGQQSDPRRRPGPRRQPPRPNRRSRWDCRHCSHRTGGRLRRGPTTSGAQGLKGERTTQTAPATGTATHCVVTRCAGSAMGDST